MRDYPGDELMRATMIRSRRKRGRRTKGDEVEAPMGKVTLEMYMDEKYPQSRSTSSRFTNDDLTLFKEHVASLKQLKSKRVCVLCGKDCYFDCGKCKKYMCIKSGRCFSTM